MKKKKVHRKTLFVDLPVTIDTRDLAIRAKKKTGSRTYDELIRKMTSDILGKDMGL